MEPMSTTEFIINILVAIAVLVIPVMSDYLCRHADEQFD